MGYKMKKVKFLGLYSKYTFQPIVYEDIRYIVEFEQMNFFAISDSYFRIYEYRVSEKGKVTKGKLLCDVKVSSIKVYKGGSIELRYGKDSGELPINSIPLRNIHEEGLLMYLPDLMKSLFAEWVKKRNSDYKSRQEMEEKLNWDGVVK